MDQYSDSTQWTAAAGGGGPERLTDSLSSERKTLTLLFIESSETMPLAFERELDRLAVRHGGTRDRFAHSGTLIFFEDAGRCVGMAMALQRHAVPLRLRIGITTASCRVATFRSEGELFTTLLGAEAALAARVAASASTGSILISPSTYALVRDAVHADARGCMLAEEYDHAGTSGTIIPAPARGGPEASTFAGLGTF